MNLFGLSPQNYAAWKGEPISCIGTSPTPEEWARLLGEAAELAKKPVEPRPEVISAAEWQWRKDFEARQSREEARRARLRKYLAE